MHKRFLPTFIGLVFLLVYSDTKAQTYHYYFGNIHAHSSYSDGNKDTAAGSPQTPTDNYSFAKQTYNFNFLGISEHNHSQAGMHLADYRKGLAEADLANQDGQFVCMYGMEYGVIANGGHVVIYGIDSLVGWEANNHSIYSPQYDYASLWRIIANRPKAFATLAHPANADYNNLVDVPYSDTADIAIAGSAIRSGSAFSETKDYSDGPPSGVYNSYFRHLLSLGYRVAPSIDHDNHFATFGRTSQSRTVVLAESLHRDSIMAAYRAMRFYASDDWNTQVNFTVNGYPLGSTITTGSSPIINVSIVDVDVTDTISSIKVYYGVPGSTTLGTVLTSVTNAKQLSFVHNSNPGSSFYYYLEILQKDGDKIWTAPIWVNRTHTILPLNVTTLKGAQKKDVIELNATINIHEEASVVLEKSFKGNDYMSIATVTTFPGKPAITIADKHPVAGYQYYRLKFTEKDGSINYSAVAAVLYTDNTFVLKSIYPNPAVSDVSMEIIANKAATATIKIYNAEGKLMRQFAQGLTSGKNLLKHDVHALASGTYHIVVVADDVKLESTFIKH